jgi:hypothetical protein
VNDHDDTPQPERQPDADIEQIASVVYERIGERIEQRLVVPQEMPSVDQAVVLREKAPELYDLWLKIAQDKAATANYVQRAPYEVPERLAASGRPRALGALVVVLAFCGYLAWLGGPGLYLGGLIAVLDLVVMLGFFFGLRPEHLADSRPNRKRHLPGDLRGASFCAAQATPTSAPPAQSHQEDVSPQPLPAIRQLMV